MAIWVPYELVYHEGDTWYRDMHSPGFDGQLVPNPDNSLQWLGQRIVADERFAEAATKFWWPAVMGTEVTEPPEDQSDDGFEGHLLASNAQAAEVLRLADGFRSGFHGGAPYNLKDLLVEIVLSRWFRAESVSDPNAVSTSALASAGARRLLTPEELARKTLALTGFQWGRSRGPESPWRKGINNLTDAKYGYRLLYGGIDSDGIVERARDFTSLMAGVAQVHALQSSYPIVMREMFLLPDEQRHLFAGLDTNVWPIGEFGETFQIAAASPSEAETILLEGRLTAGEKKISLEFLNDYWDEVSGENRSVFVDRLVVRDQESGNTIVDIEFENLTEEDVGEGDCVQITVDSPFWLDGPWCRLILEVDIRVSGTYVLEAVVWADQAGDQLARLQVLVESDSQASAGANRIKAKLVELYDKLHGLQVTADSMEVREAYELFVEVWERKRGAYGDNFQWNGEDINIDWQSDQRFFDGTADDLWRNELDENGWALGWDWDGIGEFFDTVDWSDPHAVARTWTVVLAYLMMDYRYLYL